MATYYWVGGAGTWNNSTTTNWSLSSGGAGGAGVPTSADNVIFNTNSGTGNVSVVNNVAVCNNLTVTANQSLKIGSTFSNLTVYGSLSISSDTNIFIFNSTRFIFAATTTGKTIAIGTSDIILNSYTFNGVGGGWTLLSDITSASNSCTFTNGTLNTNGYQLEFGTVTYSATGTFNLTLGTSTITGLSYSNSWDFATTTGLTFSGASSTIRMRNLFGTTGFFGGGLTYGNLIFYGGSSGAILNITGANTFTGTISSTLSVPHTITLPSAVTTTVANWTVTGSSGNVVTLNSSTAGTQATLNKSGAGVVLSVDYLSISDINGTPSSIWYVGKNSVNVSNNTGLLFNNAYSDNVSEPTTLRDITIRITPVSVTESTTLLDSTTQTTPFLVFVTEQITSVADTSSTVAAFLSSSTEDLVVYDASTTVASFVSSVS